MSDPEALIRVFAPVARGIADGAMLSLAIIAPPLAIVVFGLLRARASFSGKAARQAALSVGGTDAAAQEP